MLKINNDWQFTDCFNEEFLKGYGTYETIRIPHNVKEVPLHYIDPNSYQMLCGYRKIINISDTSLRTFIKFEAAAHIATLYVNGKQVFTHYNGYTSFRCEISDYVKKGDNLIVVKLDTSENPSIPPFGFVVDYLTFGGIYRDVYLEQTPTTYIKDIFVKTSLKGIDCNIEYDGDINGKHLLVSIYDQDNKLVVNKEYDNLCSNIKLDIENPILWEVNNGYLYNLKLEIKENFYVKETKFGLRTISYNNNEFFINNKKVFITGLNRHQSFPYFGYAATKSLQVEDARILDEELGVNLVRTSHYPNSHYFIEECDKRGIMVFTEIPGWQHLSKEDFWRKTCINNVEEMIKEYYNHPSIVMWGVRVNESQDDDDLYVQTNKVAHKLDDTRPTTGVRYLEKSSLLEDIYSYNDFSHSGNNPGCKKKKDVSPDLNKPLLISEANGHMFPTKSFDNIQRRQDHALRHAKVLNDALKDNEHIGCIQWCMFDYPTHKDFGSGDRICYHGVLDSFRNPKMAASVYASQSDKNAVLEVSTSMDIGDYPSGQIPYFYCFTNGDSVRLYKNNDFVKEFTYSPFTALKHGPIYIDDTIGDLLESKEDFPKQKAEEIRICLNAAAKFGMANLPLKYKLKFAKVMLKYHMSFSDGYNLYSKYVGNWGGEATKWKFEAIKDGEVIKTIIKSPGSKLAIKANISSTTLIEGDTYDMAAIRILIVDENDNIASYAQLPISIKTSPNLDLIGPNVVCAEGGMAGTYIKTNGLDGQGYITLSSPGLNDINIEIKIVKSN